MKFIKMLFIVIGCTSLMCCQESLEDRAAKECKEYTQKHCPTPVVSDTRMDSMVYEPDTRTIHYCYSFLNEADNKMNTIILSTTRAITKLMLRLTNNYCNKFCSMVLKPIRHRNFTKRLALISVLLTALVKILKLYC